MSDNNQQIIDLAAIARTLWAKRKKFYIVWAVTFVLSCIWILPQPRYYSCKVVLAPESSGAGISGSVASLASSFGFDFAGSNNDAIYPTLYPDLFESPEFLVNLLSIQVETSDGNLHCDYYTYLKNHQKQNWLTKPFEKAMEGLKSSFAPSDAKSNKYKNEKGLNPFFLSRKDFFLVEDMKEKINCSIDKRTDVISLSVQDQDRLACALLADSIRVRLQSFIIDYRTKKARQDEAYYKHLTDSAYLAYCKAADQYAAFYDSHRNVAVQKSVEELNRIKNDLDAKLQTYNAFNAQYQAMTAKVQERTPSFTTLVSASVPQKPTEPKRRLFVMGMMILATMIASVWLTRKELFG